MEGGRLIGLLVALGACSFDSSGVVESSSGDGDPTLPDAPPVLADASAPDSSVPLGPFGPPSRIDAVSDPSRVDDDPSVTADLLELYFDSDRNSTVENGDIFVSKRSSPSDPWGPPELIAEISSSARDTTPKVSADGLTIWLTSDRSGSAGFDIYVSTRPDRTASWTTPVPVPELNSSSNDFLGAPTADGLAMVIASDRGAGSDHDLYLATRASTGDAWGTPVEIPGVNTSATESDGYLSADLLQLVYTSSQAGRFDIYLATRAAPEEPFDTIELMTELSTGAHDRDAFLSPDLRYVVFASTRSGNWEIYEASR